MLCRSLRAANLYGLERGGCRTGAGSPSPDAGELHQGITVHRTAGRGLFPHSLRDPQLSAPLRGTPGSGAGKLHSGIALHWPAGRALPHCAIWDAALPAPELNLRRPDLPEGSPKA
jgi:hypothetical protein